MARKNNSPASILERAIASGHKVEGRVWKPENADDFMFGKLVQIDEGVGDFDSTMLRFSDARGDEIAVWQRGTLKTKVTRGNIGQPLLLVYRGTEPPKKAKNDPMNVYDVYILSDSAYADLCSDYVENDLPF
jgi:hypothetical protein